MSSRGSDAVRQMRTALFRRGRRPGLRTAKTTLAAVLSYVLAQHLTTSPQPVLAPLTALLVVQLTMYETVASGLQRVVSVVAGVLIAVGVATWVGLTWWSLGVVVAGSLVIGRLLHLGDHLLEVPISAMLVLAVGGAEGAARDRVYETLIGAGVGVAVNVVIAAPLYVQPASDAIAELAERMAEFLRQLADQLGSGWSRELADRMLDQARRLGDEVDHADRTLARAQDSARFNPRVAEAREALPRLRTGLTGLEHTYLTIRNLCRSLLDRTYFVPSEQAESVYDAQVREALVQVLIAAADAIAHVPVVTSGTEAQDPARTEVDRRLAELHRRRDRLAELLHKESSADRAVWQQHGALLTDLDRMRIEVEAAVRSPEQAWRPPPVIDSQRRALRRIRAAARQSAERRRRRS
ncbi:MAG TPA: aromatic acid exporter family protein [Dermatophilaceae bacterium]|nr:aromatic acid exporter family protein [Dermatophilaceae bacterium]